MKKSCARWHGHPAASPNARLGLGMPHGQHGFLPQPARELPCRGLQMVTPQQSFCGIGCANVGFVPFLGMSQRSTLPIGLKIRFEEFLWKGDTGKRMGRKEDPFCLCFLGSSLGNGSAAKGRSTCCTLRWLVWDLLHTYPPGKVFSW